MDNLDTSKVAPPPPTEGAVEEAASPLNNDKFATVELNEPIVRGETTIKTVTLRKPKAGECRGLNLSEIVGLDVASLIVLIPRISNPILHQEEAENLDADDLSEMGGAIRGFFMTKAERDLMDLMMAQAQGKTG